MILRRVQRPRARLDLLEQFVYFGEQSGVDVAERYFDAVAKTCALLSRHPEAGSTYDSSLSRLAGLRQFRVKGFERYLIFYLTRRSGIDVVRVLHGARDIDSILAQEE
jgi:toxin ParE1/3/4